MEKVIIFARFLITQDIDSLKIVVLKPSFVHQENISFHITISSFFHHLASASIIAFTSLNEREDFIKIRQQVALIGAS